MMFCTSVRWLLVSRITICGTPASGLQQTKKPYCCSRPDETGHSQKVVDYVAAEMLRTSWLSRFFRGVSPNDPDPKTTFLNYVGALEELAMSAIVDVRFVVQAFRDTAAHERPQMLDRLADTSRFKRGTT